MQHTGWAGSRDGECALSGCAVAAKNSERHVFDDTAGKDPERRRGHNVGIVQVCIASHSIAQPPSPSYLSPCMYSVPVESGVR